MEVGASIVQMGWCPDKLSVHLPLLSFPASHNPENGER